MSPVLGSWGAEGSETEQEEERECNSSLVRTDPQNPKAVCKLEQGLKNITHKALWPLGVGRVPLSCLPNAPSLIKDKWKCIAGVPHIFDISRMPTVHVVFYKASIRNAMPKPQLAFLSFGALK